MKRNIFTTITFSAGKVSISVLERLSTNTIEIFNDSSSISKINTFIETSLSHIEKLIGGTVSKATFIVEPSKVVDQKINLRQESIRILGDTVNKKDIDNLIELVTKKYNNETERVILTQPLKFDVIGVMTKSYSAAPIHKKGDELKMTSAITTISRKTYEFIHQAAKAVNIEVSQILLSNQTVSQAHLSKNALANGSILININNNQVNLTVNKNNSTVASMSIYDYGFKHLIKGIMTEFTCSEKSARDLLDAHSSIRNKDIRVIYSNQIGTDDWSYTNLQLGNIIKKYLNKLVVILNKFIDQRKIEKLPIIFSGKLHAVRGIKDYLREKMNTENISVYSPLTFIEMNDDNTNGIGVINFIKVMDSVLGKHYDTIVNTNPSSLKSLRRHNEQKGWLAKIKNKIGGKYDWK